MHATHEPKDRSRKTVHIDLSRIPRGHPTALTGTRNHAHRNTARLKTRATQAKRALADW
jgi:hypothetical protein